MQDSAIPSKFPVVWASSPDTGTFRVVPTTPPAQNGAASLQKGFPGATIVPIAAGGSWPWAQDFNGILNQITAWLQWNQAGGPITYDATFQTAIGGYPNNAIVQSATTLGKFWMSTADNNTTNPDSGGAGWILVVNNVNQFPSSLTNNGWKKYPDLNSPTGYFIEQWGAASVGAPTAVTFPIAFPTACLRVVVCEGNANNGTWGVSLPTIHGVQSPTVTGYSGWGEQWNGTGWVGSSIQQNFFAKGY